MTAIVAQGGSLQDIDPRGIGVPTQVVISRDRFNDQYGGLINAGEIVEGADLLLCHFAYDTSAAVLRINGSGLALEGTWKALVGVVLLGSANSSDDFYVFNAIRVT